MKNTTGFSVSAKSKNNSSKSLTKRSVCGFLVSFSFSIGFFLSLFLPLNITWDKNIYLPGILFLTVCFTILYTLKNKRHLLISILIFCILSLIFLRRSRSEILEESAHFLKQISYVFAKNYGFSAVSASAAPEETYRLFLFCILAVFLLLLNLIMRLDNPWIFLVIVILPASFDFLMDISPSFFSLGFLLTAFLFQDLCYVQKKNIFYTALLRILILSLYLLFAAVIVPRLSPSLLKLRTPLLQKVSALETSFAEFNGFSSFTNNTEKIGFSYESAQNYQTLSNTAPVYSNKTMFHFSSSALPEETLYLRGFIGSDYREARWDAPSPYEWISLLEEENMGIKEARMMYQLPYRAADAALSVSPMEISLTPQFSATYSYLPYASKIPDSLKSGEDNLLSHNYSIEKTFSAIPLSLGNSSALESYTASPTFAKAEKIYQNYANMQYTAVDQESYNLLFDSISKLPVYQSLPEHVSSADIQTAAAEIQQFLWDHASYSLSPAAISEDNSFLEEFLFKQHKGFCVHFATAGTLLFRMYGIPARYVSGYAVHTNELKKDASGYYTCNIKDSRAHAWTEVYIETAGWVPVEMTPGSSADALIPPVALPQETPVPESEVSDTETSADKNTITENSNDNLNTNTGTNVSDNTDSSDRTPDMNHGSKLAFENGFFTRLLLLCRKFVRTFLLIFIVFGTILLLLLIRRVFIFRKRMGYNEKNPVTGYRILFQNLLRLWEKLYGIPADKLSEESFFEAFKKQLPKEEQTLFAKFYLLTEQFTFSPAVPGRDDLRTLRLSYRKIRRKLLMQSPPLKKLIYYLFYGY